MAVVGSWEDCVRNPDTDACKANCTASTGLPTSAAGFSKESCNALYSKYCSDPANQSRPICACSLPWSSYPGSNLVSQSFPNFQEPICWFNSCKATGYMKGLPSNLCPKCLQNLTINIGADVKQADIQNISQTCSGTTPTAPIAAPVSQSLLVAAPSAPSASSWLQSNAKVVGIAVAALLVVLLMVAMFL